MKQLVMLAPKHLTVREIDVPEPKAGEVRIRVRQIGICGSDIHVWHGTHPFTPYPVVQGHEFCGYIDQLGEGVSHLAIGELVTAMPQIVCGHCHACLSEQFHICENLKVRGFQADGCGQEFFVTDAERIVPLPAHFTLDQGAFMEPVAVAAHAVSRLGDIAGQNMVVMGAGTIGNLIAQVAQRMGANVLLTDIQDARLERAHECGIQHTANMMTTSLANAAAAAFGDAGFALAVEAAGAPPAIQALIPAIQKGGTILIVGVYGRPVELDMARVGEHELNVKGSMMYWRDDWLHAKDLLDQGLHIQPLIDAKYPLSEWVDAYRHIDDNPQAVMKLMVNVGMDG
ncbi:D-arabitol-phosphate dehydrogenase [Ephemeroptericola cinctiostellae]|uniref:D-arabitol-phosphate dehydrogenase n=1 Tax=Ephemeroptericola cinctiostellae TaxID=2268024 RepID=A0A345DAD3_9BURK|nr:alcohol dehydrogenase catalytic domain-containing protein [Ephemeroptericola cinctiostellae]AXF85321.1 D-arabitol-phosphate dehydrogenase [Ephemeroptericola cinctiostellae]